MTKRRGGHTRRVIQRRRWFRTELERQIKSNECLVLERIRVREMLQPFIGTNIGKHLCLHKLHTRRNPFVILFFMDFLLTKTRGKFISFHSVAQRPKTQPPGVGQPQTPIQLLHTDAHPVWRCWPIISIDCFLCRHSVWLAVMQISGSVIYLFCFCFLKKIIKFKPIFE